MKENKQNSNYKYFAFISYNSKDIKWGKRLQRKLEEYKMPATLCSERGSEPAHNVALLLQVLEYHTLHTARGSECCDKHHCHQRKKEKSFHNL